MGFNNQMGAQIGKQERSQLVALRKTFAQNLTMATIKQDPGLTGYK